MDIAAKEEAGWVKVVDDFNSSESLAFRNITDSDLLKGFLPPSGGRESLGTPELKNGVIYRGEGEN